MGPDDRICYCFNVPYRKLWHYARRGRLQRPSQMSQCLGAGTGCGWCIPILMKLFETARSGESQCASGLPENMTAEEYARQRQAYIESKRRNSFPD